MLVIGYVAEFIQFRLRSFLSTNIEERNEWLLWISLAIFLFYQQIQCSNTYPIYMVTHWAFFKSVDWWGQEVVHIKKITKLDIGWHWIWKFKNVMPEESSSRLSVLQSDSCLEDVWVEFTP